MRMTRKYGTITWEGTDLEIEGDQVIIEGSREGLAVLRDAISFLINNAREKIVIVKNAEEDEINIMVSDRMPKTMWPVSTEESGGGSSFVHG